MSSVWTIVFQCTFLVVPVVALFALLFVARIVSTTFSKKSAEIIRKRPVFHLIWGIATFFFFILYFNPNAAWPPHWIELRQQRSEVLKRIQSAGGWENLRNECVSLVASNNETEFTMWYGYTYSGTNRIKFSPPPALAALNPKEIRFYPVSMRSKEEPDYPVVHIKVFGIHSTGGHSTPFYGLDVICGKESTPYNAAPSHSASGNSHFHYGRVADGVYEVY